MEDEGRVAGRNGRLFGKGLIWDFTGLWKDMLKAHNARADLKTKVEDRRAARDAGTERGRRIRRAQLLGPKASYEKAAKALAQCATMYPASVAFQAKRRVLHLNPFNPVPVIPGRNLPPKSIIDP